MLKTTFPSNQVLVNLLKHYQPYLSTAHKRYRRSDSDSEEQSSKDHKLLYVMKKKSLTPKERTEKVEKSLVQGANINVPDHQGNTPLHIAVKKGEPEVAEFLLDHGADVTIKNSDGKTAVDLLRKRQKVTTGGSSQSSWGPEIIARLESVSTVHKRPGVPSIAIAGSSGSAANSPPLQPGTSGLPERMDYEASGLKHSLHGTAYQLHLLTLFMKRALDNQYEFRLATEMTKAEKFDDVVLRHKKGSQWNHRFLQAKHRQDESQQITLNDLINTSEGDLSLLKYFSAYLKIKDNSEFKGQIQDFTLCTNIDLDVNLLNDKRIVGITEITTPDDILSINNPGKISHRYRLTVNKNSDFYQLFKDPPDANRLAHVLLQRMDKGRLDLTIDILKQYHKGLAKEIIDIQNRQFHRLFISGNGLSASAQAFRQVFENQALKHSVYQNNPATFWKKLEDKKLSLSSSFGLEEGASTLPHDNPVNDADITDFFNHLVLATNQPNERQLRENLAQEFSEIKEINLLESDLVADYIQRKILDWFKERGGRFLSAKEGKSYIDEALKRINTLLSTGSSTELAARLEAYEVHFNNAAITALQRSMEHTRVLHVTASETPRLETIKVYQSLQTLPQYRQWDSVLFTTLDTLRIEKTLSRFVKAFEAQNSHPLWVIECSEETAGDMAKIINSLTPILQTQSNKQIIVIAPAAHPLAVGLSHNSQLSYHCLPDPSHVDNFTPETQATLLEKTVTFQGKAVPLKQLIGRNRHALPSLPLMALIDDTPVQIGTALPAVPSEAAGYYIERNLVPALIKRTILLAESEGAFPDQLVFDESEFNAQCRNNPESKIHWLQKTVSNELIWRQSQGDIAALQPYRASASAAVIESQEATIELTQIKQKVVVLSAAAGMGKSTFLTHTAQQLKAQWPDAWVISIDLNQQIEALKMLQEKITRELNALEAATTLITDSLQLTTPFEQQLWRQTLQSPESAKVILLFDGFDEISPTYQAPVIQLLQILQPHVQQLWVSTHPHWEGVLAQHFGQLPFSVNPLSSTAQVEFLEHYWTAKLTLNAQQQQHLVAPAKKSVSPLGSLTENPLQLQILADLFCEKFKAGASFTKDKLNYFDRLKLFQRSIDTKYAIFLEKKGVAKTQQIKANRNDISHQQNHQRLAVTLLFPEQQQFLLKALSLDTISLFTHEELARYGLVSEVGGNVQFIHRTYAEYYAALVLFVKAVKNHSSEALADFLLCEMLPQEAQPGVNAFLESWFAQEGRADSQLSHRLYGERLQTLQAGAWPAYQFSVAGRRLENSRYPGYRWHLQVLHPAAQNGYSHTLLFLFNSLKTLPASEILKQLLLAQNQGGDTPLHAAAEGGHEAAVAVLLQAAAALPQADAYQLLQQGNQQGQSALHLSIEAGHAQVSAQLLQWSQENLPLEQYNKLLLQKNRQQQTPYRLSIVENQPQITDNLLQRYSSLAKTTQLVLTETLEQTNTYGKTCYELAIQNGSTEALEHALRWLSQRMNTLLPTDMPYPMAVALNQLYTVKLTRNAPLLKLLATAEGAGAFRLTPLHLAALKGEPATVQALLAQGNQLTHAQFLDLLTQPDLFGYTVLHLAALNGHTAIVDPLLTQAGSIRLLAAQTRFGQIALHLAIIAEDADMVEKLLAAAKQFGNPTLTQQLLTPDSYQQTPLHLAINVIKGQEEEVLETLQIMELLFKQSSQLNPAEQVTLLFTATAQGDTPLHLAILNDAVESVDHLLQQADQWELLNRVLLKRNEAGNPPLHLAVLEGNTAMVEFLLEYENNPQSTLVKEMLCTKNLQGDTPLHLAAQYDPSLLNDLLNFVEKLPAPTAKSVLLATNNEQRNPLSLLFVSHYFVEKEVVEKIDRLFSQKLTLSEHYIALDNAVYNNELEHRESVESVILLKQKLASVTGAYAKQSATRVAGLQQVLQQSHQLHLSPNPCSSGSLRITRAIQPCSETALRTEEPFHYQPLPEQAPRELAWAAREYLQFALILQYQQVSYAQEQKGEEKWLHYQRAIGAILSEGTANHSPREAEILDNHYQQAQQFVDRFPKQQLFDSIPEGLTSPAPGKRQCWWLENGRYSLSLFWDGRRYALYSPDLTYQHLLYANPGVPLSEIAALAHAFFQWRSGSSAYTIWTLKESFSKEVLQKIHLSNFWQPQRVVSDQVLLAQTGARIEGVPIQALQALLRLDGKPVAPEALHADFLRLKKANIRLHVESLHQVLPTLNADEQRNLARVVRQYGWPADSSALRDLPEAQQRPLLQYHRLIMEAFKGNEAIPITLDQLTQFSWQALKQELANYLRELPPEIRTPVTKALWSSVKSNMKQVWSMGKQPRSQALFFLPDMIRFANSEDPRPLMITASMMVGDHYIVPGLNSLRTTIINRAHKNFLLILRQLPPLPSMSAGLLASHAKNLAKMLHRIPLVSPIFTGLTIYSIVELSQQLQTLPEQSVERQAVISELTLQVTALALIVSGPFLGAAAGPLWIVFTATSLFVAAENFKQTAQLNVPFWKALGFSLGFYQDELQSIYQGRDLAALNLALAEKLSTFINATHPTLGWVVAKVPPLDYGEWRNTSIDQVPVSIQNSVQDKDSQEPYPRIGHQYIDVGGFKRIKLFSTKNTLVSSSAPQQGGWQPVRDKLLATYWQQRVYQATSVSTTVQFTAATGISSNHGNYFLTSFPSPWGNYTLKNVVTKKSEIGIEEHRSICSQTGSVSLNLCNAKFSFGHTLFLMPAESIALYADNRTFANPIAQSSLYFFFDPREGDNTLEISTDGIKIWDQINQRHNANYFSTQDPREYLIIVQVGHKEYPNSIIFTPRLVSTLTVADKLHRIASRYFIQLSPMVPFKIIDEAASVDIIFWSQKTTPWILSSIFLFPEDFLITVTAPEQEFNSIRLVGNKTHLGLTLSEYVTINNLKLAAQQVEIFHAQGVYELSILELDCQVETFTVTIHGNLTVSHCGDALSLIGSKFNPGALYTKLFNTTDFTRYQLQLAEPKALPELLKTLQRFHYDSYNLTTFSVQEANGTWQVSQYHDGAKQLNIIGQLNTRNATLLLQAEQFTLILFTETFQPDFVIVEHDTPQANLPASQRLQRAALDCPLALLFTTPEEGMKVQQGLALLETLPRVGRGSVLIFHSPEGYPVIHRFPQTSQRITLNGIHYQINPGGRLYATGALGDRITSDSLLRYNDSSAQPVGIAFPHSLNTSQLSQDNGSLTVNHLQLNQLPAQTLLYFGPTGQQEILPLQALQDTLLLPSAAQQTPSHHHRHHHQRRHRRQIPDMPSSASCPTPWITTLWRKLSARLPAVSTPWFAKLATPKTSQFSWLSSIRESISRHLQSAQHLLELGIRTKPTALPMTQEVFSGLPKPLDLDKVNSFLMMFCFFLTLRQARQQQKTASKALPKQQVITDKHRIAWLKELEKLEKRVEELFKRLAQQGKTVDKRHQWPQWGLEDLQEQSRQFAHVDSVSQQEIARFEEQLQETLGELDEILQTSAKPFGEKRQAGSARHRSDTTESAPKPPPAEEVDENIQELNHSLSENDAIISAIKNNDLRQVNSYLGKNKDVNARTKGGRTLLMVAVENKCSSVLVELLIDNGADINAEDREGESAINLAAYHGSCRLIELLIYKGVNIKDKTEKNSPFSSVAESCLPQRTKEQLIKLLTEGKNIDKSQNAAKLTRNLVEQMPTMHHRSIAVNTFTPPGKPISATSTPYLISSPLEKQQ